MKLEWHRVASHLGTTVHELGDRLTYDELLDWLAFLEWDDERDSKVCHYLAALTAEVRRSWVKEPKAVKIQDFIIRFETKDVKKKNSKATWLGFFGMKPEQN